MIDGESRFWDRFMLGAFIVAGLLLMLAGWLLGKALGA